MSRGRRQGGFSWSQAGLMFGSGGCDLGRDSEPGCGNKAGLMSPFGGGWGVAAGGGSSECTKVWGDPGGDSSSSGGP